MIPTNAKQSGLFIYVDEADVAEMMADAEFVPIQGSPTSLHGSVLGYAYGKTVIAKRLLDE